MFQIFRSKNKQINAEDPQTETNVGLFKKLKLGLAKTRKAFTHSLTHLIFGKKELTPEILEELETIFLSSDMGYEVTQEIIKTLTDQLDRKALGDAATIFDQLKILLLDILKPFEKKLDLSKNTSPTVILFVGVNGVGKTTTIGKLAKHLQILGHKPILAAGDTFRAAAIEQLAVWSERNQIPMVTQAHGSDSASVIYDTIQAAKSRGCDVVLADTAGRLHTQDHLVAELKKIKRVIGKIDTSAPHETFIVLDASIGQNALIQAKAFHEAIGVTGIIMTKLDGTAKGGILFAIVKALKIPLYYIGIGEGIDDLRPFDATMFVDAILEIEHDD